MRTNGVLRVLKMSSSLSPSGAARSGAMTEHAVADRVSDWTKTLSLLEMDVAITNSVALSGNGGVTVIEFSLCSRYDHVNCASNWFTATAVGSAAVRSVTTVESPVVPSSRDV